MTAKAKKVCPARVYCHLTLHTLTSAVSALSTRLVPMFAFTKTLKHTRVHVQNIASSKIGFTPSASLPFIFDLFYVASVTPAPLSSVDLSKAYGINSESVVREVLPFGVRQYTSMSPNSDSTCLHAPATHDCR